MLRFLIHVEAERGRVIRHWASPIISYTVYYLVCYAVCYAFLYFTFPTSDFCTATFHETISQPLIEKYQLEGTSEQETGANQTLFQLT